MFRASLVLFEIIFCDFSRQNTHFTQRPGPFLTEAIFVVRSVPSEKRPRSGPLNEASPHARHNKIYGIPIICIIILVLNNTTKNYSCKPKNAFKIMLIPGNNYFFRSARRQTCTPNAFLVIGERQIVSNPVNNLDVFPFS